MSAIHLEERIHIAASAVEVFSAWQTADAVADWFAPMAIVRPEAAWDFRVNGQYAIRMTLPGNQTFTTSGHFEDIVTNEKIIMTWHCDAFPDPPSRVKILFLPRDTGTEVCVRHERFESDETCANHKHGWELCLASLKSSIEEGLEK